MTREQLIETMARAMCRAKWFGIFPVSILNEKVESFWKMEVVNVTAALTAIEAAGMRVTDEHETDANIALRDAFIVREGLWQKFIDHLPSAAQEDSTSE